VTVFQRTPNFSVPANNRPLTDEERKAWFGNLPNYLRMLRGTGMDVAEAPGAARRAASAAAAQSAPATAAARLDGDGARGRSPAKSGCRNSGTPARAPAGWASHGC